MLSNLLSYFALFLVLFYVFCKIYEHYKASQIKRVKSSNSNNDSTPTVAPTKSIFGLYTQALKQLLFKSKVKQAGYLTNFENYQKKPQNEQIGLEHAFVLHKSVILLYDYEAISKVLLDSKTFQKASFIGRKVHKKATSREEFEKRDKLPFGLPRGLGGSRFFGRYGVAFLNGDEHKRLRQLLEPAFYNIERFVPVFKKKTEECLDLWEEEISKNSNFKPVPYFPRLTLDMLGLCVFNHDFNSLSNSKEDEYINSYHYVMSKLGDLKRFAFSWFNHLPTKENYELDYHLNNLDKMTFDLIEKSEEKVKQLSENNRIAEEDLSLLDRMVETTLNASEEDKLVLEELRDNVIIFFVAGHETTATALGSAMFCLAKHQQVQEKLFEEINEVSQREEFKTSSWNEIVTQMPYLKAVLNEVLRLYPPAPQVVPRTNSIETTLCGYKIPKGTLLNVNIAASHRGNQWGDPLVFRPERWLDENKGQLPPLISYVPFGGGRHICIGNKFSLCEQQVFIVHLLKRFRLDFPENKTYEDFPYKEGGSIFISVDDNLEIKLTRRNE
ncbi:hypothetical protein ABK040_008141 [Willaertia magna]